MSEGKKDKQILSHISNEELAERSLTSTDKWIKVPQGMSAVEYFLENNKEIKEAYERKKPNPTELGLQDDFEYTEEMLEDDLKAIELYKDNEKKDDSE